MEDNGSNLREKARHYIPASDADIEAMLQAVGKSSLDGLFDHIPEDVLFSEAPDLPDELEYDALFDRLREISESNVVAESYLGDSVPDFEPSPVVAPLCDIRNLTTAYTPYQPELSQGTLLAHWIYQCSMARLTGFEAVNASLYERSTSIFEGVAAATRMGRGRTVAIIPETLYPGDIEVVETLARETVLEIVRVPVDATGRIDRKALEEAADAAGDRLAAVVFPQVNTFGLIEDVDGLTDFAAARGAKSVAVIDPLLLGPGGLKAPSAFGDEGCDIIVGEAQHLALEPNFGGPGLGLFGVRFTSKERNGVRSAPGRFIGKAKDASGRECRVGVLSTREQHIRKDKATSNICSNQAFIATLIGAALLERGDEGLRAILERVRGKVAEAAERLTRFEGVRVAFPEAKSFHELTLEIPSDVPAFLAAAREDGIWAGADVSDRAPGGRHLVKLSFNNREQNLDKLAAVFERRFGAPSAEAASSLAAPESTDLRGSDPGLPAYSADEVVDYYRRIAELNVSPDSGCYPLGSCTMKYNPKVNDWAATLPGFAKMHPQAPLEDAQGCLYVLHEIQEWFKKITGLPAVTTQPVAGAQGELVGIKMMQAYHREHGEKRDVILIPKSAHGTNFATATMAGFSGKNGKIVYLDADTEGRVLNEDLDKRIAEYGERIAGVMITNPNTSGIFETSFREIAEKIHKIGGLVYMDGANMNAIAGRVDLNALGVDAVHNNLHKTWTIPHGGGGPGDAIVAVSERLAPYLPGYQIEKDGGRFRPVRTAKSIGSFHRNWGNFAHKVRCYTYLLRLGREGVRRMSAMAVLSARYLHNRLRDEYTTLPVGSDDEPRMHEFILTPKQEDFVAVEATGLRKTDVAPRIGKLFLDFGFHAPTVAWPEPLGLMIEPTESYTKAELDRFADAVRAIIKLVREHPEVLKSAPHFTPIDRVEEVDANREVCLSEPLQSLPEISPARIPASELVEMPLDEIYKRIVEAMKQEAAA